MTCQAMFCLAAIAAMTAACAGAPSASGVDARNTPAPSPASCGVPPPIPTPVPGFLNYPPSDSTNVSTSIGQMIVTVQGLTIVLSTASGAQVPLESPMPAPTPYPTPFATPSPFSALGNPMTFPLPALSPSTTYNVTDTYVGWSDNPPACQATQTQSVGTFQTES